MLFFDIHIVSIVSSVLAQKLKCPSSARLGLEPSQLGLARAGKFQLELISTNFVSLIWKLDYQYYHKVDQAWCGCKDVGIQNNPLTILHTYMQEPMKIFCLYLILVRTSKSRYILCIPSQNCIQMPLHTSGYTIVVFLFEILFFQK